MTFHATREYDLITLDEITPSRDFDSGFPHTAAGRLSPIQEDMPSWRRWTPAEVNHGKTDQADVAATSGLQKTLLRVEQGLASVEEWIRARYSQLYATVGEMAEKVRYYSHSTWLLGKQNQTGNSTTEYANRLSEQMKRIQRCVFVEYN